VRRGYDVTSLNINDESIVDAANTSSTYRMEFLLFSIGQNVVNFGLNSKFKPSDNTYTASDAILNVENLGVLDSLKSSGYAAPPPP